MFERRALLVAELGKIGIDLCDIGFAHSGTTLLFDIGLGLGQGLQPSVSAMKSSTRWRARKAGKDHLHRHQRAAVAFGEGNDLVRRVRVVGP